MEASDKTKKEICVHDSTFTAAGFLERLCLNALCRGVSANDVRLSAWAELEKARLGLSKDLVFRGKDSDGNERWTTAHLYNQELRAMALSVSQKDRPSPVTKREVEAAISTKGTLNSDQANAVRHLTLSPGQVKVLLGGAGTGKTFCLDAVREAIEASQGGAVVIGTSLSSRATRELKVQAHIKEAYNIRKLLYEIDAGRLKLNSRTHIIMDEASLTGTRDFHRILTEVRKSNATLYAVGDYRQHQSVEAGGCYLGLTERLPTKELKEIIRQRDPEDRAMVEAFRDKKVARALASLVKRDRLHVDEELTDSQVRLVTDWAADPTVMKEKLIVASTNEQRKWLSLRCQAALEEKGKLSGDGITIEDGYQVFAGERILFRTNIKLLGISNGDFATVLKVDRAKEELKVKLADDERVVTVCLKTLDREKVTPGWAVTSFLSQGGSFSSIYLFVHGPFDAQKSYVMGSRHKEKCSLYTTVDDAGEGLASLVRKMGQERLKVLAMDTGSAPRTKVQDEMSLRLTR
jgi:ATP-dependent exoDNAse (exonuclease V) alpha subunit